MAIEFDCDACGKHYSQPESNAGKKARCKCGSIFTVPQASQSELEPTDLYGFADEPVQKLPAGAQRAFDQPVVYQAPAPAVATPPAARPSLRSFSGGASTAKPSYQSDSGGGGLRAAIGTAATIILVLLGLAAKSWRAYNRSHRNSNTNQSQRYDNQPTGAELRRMAPAGN